MGCGRWQEGSFFALGSYGERGKIKDLPASYWGQFWQSAPLTGSSGGGAGTLPPPWPPDAARLRAPTLHRPQHLAQHIVLRITVSQVLAEPLREGHPGGLALVSPPVVHRL